MKLIRNRGMFIEQQQQTHRFKLNGIKHFFFHSPSKVSIIDNMFKKYTCSKWFNAIKYTNFIFFIHLQKFCQYRMFFLENTRTVSGLTPLIYTNFMFLKKYIIFVLLSPQLGLVKSNLVEHVA